MTFQEKFAKLREQIESNIPESSLTIMHRATNELQASGIEADVAKVGQEFPIFSLPNQDGDEVTRDELLKGGPLVITFYRGVWCPYCNLDLKNIEEYADRFREAGGQVLAISPELPEHSKESIRKNKLSYPILFDKGNTLAETLGLRFALPSDLVEVYKGFNITLDTYNGDESWTLPMPARFLVDTDGAIKYAEAKADYTDRPDPDDLLAALRDLKGVSA